MFVRDYKLKKKEKTKNKTKLKGERQKIQKM